MAVNLKRPVLLGGAALSLLFVMSDVLGHLLGDFSGVVVLIGLGGAGLWWLRRRSPFAPLPPLPAKTLPSPAAVQQAIADTQQILSQITTEATAPDRQTLALPQPDLSPLQAQASQITQELARQTLQVAILGSPGAGKTTLLQQLQATWTQPAAFSVTFTEVPFAAAPSPASLVPSLNRTLDCTLDRTFDLALFVIAADITASEQQALQTLAAQTRTLLVVNKQDQLLPDQRATVLQQIRQHVPLAASDVVAIATAPAPIKVRQHQADGTLRQWLEPQPADLNDLPQRLQQIVMAEGAELILASAWQQAVQLKASAQAALLQLRRDRALPMVEQFQWMAAATAFACPLPTVDVIATTAINAQMVLDLGTLYRQKLTLPQAQKMAASLGKVLLKLGLVELSSQVIFTLLKTNALTFVAGGCVQGISAAYLTRITGLSLMEYFSSQEPNLTLTEASPLAIERWTQILQRVFQANQQSTFLLGFINKAMEKLVPVPAQLAVASSPALVVEPSEPPMLQTMPTAVAMPTAIPTAAAIPAPADLGHKANSGNSTIVSDRPEVIAHEPLSPASR